MRRWRARELYAAYMSSSVSSRFVVTFLCASSKTSVSMRDADAETAATARALGRIWSGITSCIDLATAAGLICFPRRGMGIFLEWRDQICLGLSGFWWCLAVLAVVTAKCGWARKFFAYGRLMDVGKGWEWTIVPRGWFFHMYLTGIGVSVWGMLMRWEDGGDVHMVQVLFGLHVLKRLWECFFVHVPSARCSLDWTERDLNRGMPLLMYIAAHVHYIGVPLSFYVGGLESSESNWDWKVVVVWLFGSFLQTWGHFSLRSLRQPYTTSYRMPTGGAFAFTNTAFPHYLGEIIVYVSFALAFSTDLTQFLALGILAWTTANLSVTALRSYKWYQQTFKAAWNHHGPQYAVFPNIF